MNKETVIQYILQNNDEDITTYEQLRQHDSTQAYAEFLSIEQAKKELIIPKPYHDYFKDRCECGSEFMIKKSLTIAQCCNPKCRIKMAYRLSSMLENFGLKGISDRTCVDIIRSYDYIGVQLTHIEVFVLSLFEIPGILMNTARGDTYMRNIAQIMSEHYTFGELISKLAIPDFGPQSSEIFHGIDNIDQFLAKVKEFDTYRSFFASRGVFDATKVNNFIMYIQDIVLISSVLQGNIRKQGIQRIPICITGSVRPDSISMNKKEFINYLNKSSCTKDGIQLLEFSLSSAMQSVPYIVADYRSPSQKYTVGERRGVLITSTELLNQVRRLVNECENR